jgi:hypothetical protein
MTTGKMKEKCDAIVKITDDFCAAHLNEEYGALSRRMTAALSRKRPSPLESGQAASWAAGVLYALAQVNFLFDPGQDPHMSATELCELVGVSQSTATLDLVQMDPEWCLPSLLADNPMAWMILVDGLITDARSLPKDVQEEAFQLGLIPYVPQQGTAALEPSQFKVNEAWIAFRLNDEPIHTVQDGDFHFVALMDAASGFVLSFASVPVQQAGPTKLESKRVLKEAQAHKKRWPKTFFVPAELPAQFLAEEAERLGIEVVRVAEEELLPFVSEALEGFAEHFGDRGED